MSDVKRSKSWGYEVEVQALKALQPLFGGLDRTGASAQKSKGWPDLVQSGTSPPFHFLVTKEKGPGKPLLITMSVDDFLAIASLGLPNTPTVVVGVKGRAKMWIQTIWGELQEGAKAWQRRSPLTNPLQGKPIRGRRWRRT